MALNFDGATQAVDCGSDALVNNMNIGITVMAWIRVTSLGVDQQIAIKDTGVGSGFWSLSVNDASGNLRFTGNMTTTDFDYITNDGPLSAGIWAFVAASGDFNGFTNFNIYTGSLSTKSVVSTYGTSENGAGVYVNDASNSLVWGNQGGAIDRRLVGDIAYGCITEQILTLSEIKSWQFRPRPWLTLSRGFWAFGFTGTGVQPDWSGTGVLDGTVTAATVVDHVPLSAPFAWAMSGDENMPTPAANQFARPDGDVSTGNWRAVYSG